jgi:hypothetical protein
MITLAEIGKARKIRVKIKPPFTFPNTLAHRAGNKEK